MRSMLAITKRELRSAFNSPVAYLVIVFFLLASSLWFFFIQQFFAQDAATLRGYFGLFPALFVLLVPALTMRSWAEERKLGTDELLLTFPVRDSALVLGKFFAGFLLLALILLLTLPVPLCVMPFGSFERGQVIGEYLGVLFLGAAGLSVGYLVSALARNQISAFLATVSVLLVLTFVGEIPKFVGLPDWLAATLAYVSIDNHFESFRKGLFDTRDASYFALITFAALYGNAKVLLLGRWK